MPGRMQLRGYTGIIVSVLLIIALLMIFTDPWSTLRNDSKAIILKNPSEIDRISISGRTDSVLLIREADQWMLSGEEPVSRVTVENLLFAAGRLQVTSILTEDPDWSNREVKRVEFLKGDKVVLGYDFMVYGDKYLVRLPGTDKGFFVAISGFTGHNLDKVFSAAVNHYREHILLDILPGEISLIEIELGSGKSYRFTQDLNGAFACEPLNGGTILPSGSPEDLPVRLLFSYFTSIRFERLTNVRSSSLTASNAESELIARLHIESRQGEKHTLQVFPYYEKPGGDPHLFLALAVYNNNAEAMLINYIYLDVLMRDPSHYFATAE